MFVSFKFLLIQVIFAVNPFIDFYSVLCLQSSKLLDSWLPGEGLWLSIALCRWDKCAGGGLSAA